MDRRVSSGANRRGTGGNRSCSAPTSSSHNTRRPRSRFVPYTPEEMKEVLKEYVRIIGPQISRSYEMVTVHLDELQTSLILDTEIQWSEEAFELIKIVKYCMWYGSFDYEVTTKQEVERAARRYREPGGTMDEISKITEDDFAAVGRMAKLSYDGLARVLKLASPRQGYKFFESLMGVSEGSEIGYMEFLVPQAVKNLQKIAGIGLVELLELVILILAKGKSALSGESRAVAFRSVRHQQFSYNADKLLGDLIDYLLDAIENPKPGVDQQHIFDALISIVESVPEIDLSTPAMQRLILLLHQSSQFSSTVKIQIPTLKILKLMKALVMAPYDENWDSIPGLPRNEFLQHVVMYSLSALSELASLVTIQITDNLDKATDSAIAAIDVLATFAKYHFENFFPHSIKVATFIGDHSATAALFEILFYTGGLKQGLTIDEAKMLERFLPCQKFFVAYYGFLKTVTLALGSYLDSQNLETDYLDDFVKMWHIIMVRLPNFTYLRHSDEIAEARMDCFSAVNESLFEHMSHKRRIFCLVNVLGGVRHESDLVCSKAARCIALFLGYKSIADDIQFVLDALDVIKLKCNRGDLSSRINFAWAGANLADVLAKYHHNSCSDALSWAVYEKLYELGTALAEDNQKLRHHGCRLLGSLVSWTPSKFLEENEHKLHEYLANIGLILGKQIEIGGTDFKGRWNAAHALANIVRNQEVWEKFYTGLCDVVFPPFFRAIQKSENYKERTYCVKAISLLKQKKHFFVYYKAVWASLLEALPNIAEPTNSSHHRVEQAYREEVACAIVNMCSTLDTNDPEYVDIVESTFAAKYETLLKALEITCARNVEAFQSLLSENAWQNALKVIQEMHEKDSAYPRQDINGRIQSLPPF